MSTANDYSRNFYNELEVSSRKSAQVLVPLLNHLFKPGSVIDVGCGSGEFLKAFTRNGVLDTWGIEGVWLNQQSVDSESQRITFLDLEQEWDLGRNFDIALCLEVAEHLTHKGGENLVKSLSRAANRIVFSAALPGQGGTHHINEQFPGYWISEFSKCGLGLELDLREVIWHDKRIAPWYRQNLLIFSHQSFGYAIGSERYVKLHDEIYTELLSTKEKIIQKMVNKLRRIFLRID